MIFGWMLCTSFLVPRLISDVVYVDLKYDDVLSFGLLLFVNEWMVVCL